MNIYLVGKPEIQDASGTTRLLLYAIYEEECDAQIYIKHYSDKYYKEKPFLCPLVIKKIIR